MDADMSGDISDSEYEEFYTEFIAPFLLCATGGDWLITTALLTPCVTTVVGGKITLLKSFEGHEAEVFKFMDRVDDATFYDYLFLRKLVVAMKSCSDGGYFVPNKLYCGLAITSPRSPTVTSQTEKMIFNAAIVLTDGFYYGQTSFLSPLQMMAVSYLYNWFGDYELPYNDGII
jgi:hypothetical protein